ncbi:toxin Cry1Ac domain D-VI-related protein [Listeria seeligeri]|uniref:toxin Cry1Ac domain D-VI-related protein n=1 Tax=Listeria seeligeri TaxID=1640 RepID=UPI0022EC13D8|nr:toxin Cry1Ac domain D-VI-related protein [Listeria seeligeri]
MKKISLTKKNKWLIGIVLGALVVAGGIGWGVTAYAEEKEEEQRMIDLEKQLTNVTKQIDALYLDDSKELLAKDVSLDKIKKAETALDALKEQTLPTKAMKQEVKNAATDWGHADYMYTYQMNVEKLLDPNKVLREDANISQVEQQRQDLIKNSEKGTFAKSLDPVLKEAVAQQTQIETATKQVNSLYTSTARKEVKEGLTWDNYNTAKTSVDKVKQVKAKKELTSGLSKANDTLKAQDAKQAAIEEKAAELANAQAATEESSTDSDTGNNATTNSGGSSSQGNGNNGNSASNASGSSGSSGSSSSEKSASKSSSGSSSSKSSGGSTSSKSSGGSSSSGEMKEGDSWTIDWNEGGTMDSDSGRSYDYGTWK